MRWHLSQETSSGKQPMSLPNTKRFILARICKDPQETKIQWRDRKLCWSRPSRTSSLHAADVVCVIFGVLISILSLLPCIPPLPSCSNSPPAFPIAPLFLFPASSQVEARKGRCPDVRGHLTKKKQPLSKSLSFSRHSLITICKFSILTLLKNQDFTDKVFSD